MTEHQIKEVISFAKKTLEIVAADEGWKAIHEADHTGEQETNMNDAIHYLEQILCNL